MSSRRMSLALPFALLALPAAPAVANTYDDDYTVDWAELADGGDQAAPPPTPGTEVPVTSGTGAPEVPGTSGTGAPEVPGTAVAEVPVVDVTPAPAPPVDVPVRGLTLRANGKVTATKQVPLSVRRVIAAANRIARLPYRYGGGHGTFTDTAYDCSGSVSFALHGAGLLNTTLNSTGFMSWGRKGKGRWISIYANHGHAFMVIGGLRYDTSARKATGSRWGLMDRSTRGFRVRHPQGF